MTDTKTAPPASAKPPHNRALSKIIAFNVSDKVYHLLSQKSVEKKMSVNPSLYVRKMILESIKLDDPQLIKKSLNTISSQNADLNMLIKFIIQWIDYFTLLHFSSHKELPPDEKGPLVEAALQKTRDFFKAQLSASLDEGNVSAERIFAKMADLDKD